MARKYGIGPASKRKGPRYGPTGRASDMGAGPDLDTTSVRRRIHEAVAVFTDEVDDWERWDFDSSRVASAQFSPARRQLIVSWTNGRQPYIYDAVPPVVWSGFIEAGSAGRFVNTTLNTYPYRPQ